jgi:hypothetical protein
MKNSLLIIGVLITLFSCKKTSSTTPTPTGPTTSQIQMVTHSPVFPYDYQYTTSYYPTVMEDTAAAQNLAVTYTVTNGLSRSYYVLTQDVSYNPNTTTDSFRVTVYINGIKKYYNAGKHLAQVRFSL